MAGAAVTICLDNLSELEICHPDLISGAEMELKRLRNDVKLLQAFLRDEVKKEGDGGFLQMQRQIKEVIYEVEDAIDACLSPAAAAKTTKNIILLRRLDTKRYALAKVARSLTHGVVRGLLQTLANYMTSSSINSDATGTSVAGRRSRLLTTEQKIKEKKVVGLEEEEKIITGYLMERNEKLDVITIIGMPGLGKTTLTWKIYESERIAYKFPTRIWVHVSKKFKIKDVCLSILKTLTSEDMCSLTVQELSETILACLEEEKFLLVLDDVWSLEDWKAIQNILPDSNGMGKVLITSRNEQVGEHASANRKPHELRRLRDEESWELLKEEVFGTPNLQDYNQELVKVGEAIASKCGGLPLQIVAAARILDHQRTINEWENVSENMDHLLSHSNTSLSNMVELSYSMLPDELRECFLYVGVFLEGREISVWTLTRLWIAEGFVTPIKGKSLEEIATQNLDHLISMGLVVAEKITFKGEVKTCRLHDMVRQFCITKSMEQRLFQEVMPKSKKPLVSEDQKIHRLCFHSDLSKFLAENKNGPQVRSFLSFYEEPMELEPQYISVIADGFQKLRILESKCIKFRQFPAKITRLIHLRYLTLFIEDLPILPQQISQLWNLQTLVVETKARSITMKANILSMIRLRHLKTKAAFLLDGKCEGEGGQNLDTLNRLSPESCTESVSKRVQNIKTLGISGKLASLFKGKFLTKLDHLEKLKLVNRLSTDEPTHEDMLHGLPKRNCFPPNLKRLTLSNTFLGWQHMPALAAIETLEALKLQHNAFVGVSWIVSSYNFPSLQFLLVENTDLVAWKASPDAFPTLRFLVVNNCENLKEIPECLGTHLEKLEVNRLPHSAVESARKIGETKHQEKPQSKFAVPFILNIGPVC